MSGKIKIGGLVFAAALFVLLGRVPSGGAAPDLCCGNYVGKPLRAVFSNSYTELGVTYTSNIFNDVTDYNYQCSAPGDSCVYLFRAGHAGIWVTKADSGRYVNMKFDGEKNYPSGATCAKNAYFIDEIGIDRDRAAGFMFRTTGGYTGSRNEAGELILTGGTSISPATMVVGQTAYFNTWIEFNVADDPNTPDDPATPEIENDESLDQYHVEGSPVKVSCESAGGGKRRWVVRPIHEAFWIYTPIKVKKTVTWDKSYSSVGTEYRDVWSDSYSSCNHGKFYFPFELIFEER
jgi:hypothetical protein